MDINDDDNDDIQVVDLCTPVNDVASAIVTTNSLAQLSLAPATSSKEQILYKPRTLTLNSARHTILPAFPASMENDDRPDLLLANVPGKCRIDSN
jgi:hypothetical protein